MLQTRKRILFKISGDLLENETALDLIRAQAGTHTVVVICGGGTQTGKALEAKGFAKVFDQHGRVLTSDKEKMIAYHALQKEAQVLKKRLGRGGIMVLPSVLWAGTVICHVNADNLVKTYYMGFDEIYVLTLTSRKQVKAESFVGYPKVKVIGVKLP